MEALTRLITYLVPLIILITIGFIYFGGEKSLFVELKSVVSKLPTVKFGVETQQAGALVVPEATQKKVDQITRKINLLKGKGPNCISSYANIGLGDLGAVSLEFNKFNSTDSNLVVRGGEQGRHEIQRIKLENTLPCVIAGIQETKNFYDYFLAETKLPITDKYFKEVNALVIFGGKISFEGKTYDLKDGGWFFTPDGRNMCFFPTNSDWYVPWFMKSCSPGEVLDEACFVVDNINLKIPYCLQ